MKGLPALLLCGLIGSCHQRSAITVAVVFRNRWMLGDDVLPLSDQALVKQAAFDTLRHAFDGYAVHFVERPAGDRTIRVEETPYATYASQRVYAAGLTYPLSTVSTVRIDILFSGELAAVHCPDLRHCTETRADMLQALGRGVGATAAHELGHQVGFEFVGDVLCESCYDGRSATTSVHFFGEKHWSDSARQKMRVVLPTA